MSNAYAEGYFYFSPEHYPAESPADLELDEKLNDQNYFYEFYCGYEDAKKDFLIEKTELLDFINDYNDLLDIYSVNELDAEFEISVEVHPDEFKDFRFIISDFDDYLYEGAEDD